ncbi:hypothetical protein CHJ41_12035 [Listeria monocytogenes]|uniref:N-acetylmuramoyl-L-alanine amidase n=1 Tax=Listeria monocytogenes TaxID=1639 RepID=A0A7U7YKD6_LISMN|nr:hypothetical protein [Listeria monocytogenes]MDA20316.1 hypothetical protein [Listeria monocytogenes serotype 4a]EAC4812712.1 hypothetical protein [Listeria monocytogenes]EAC7281411.1 hypothetical protein [Listeria monocytogenes]EAC7287930.1 hypothetical protein [Listeria monocytogenes]EAC7298441.1 hypothetical protein [Listeria monocytogenes]
MKKFTTAIIVLVLGISIGAPSVANAWKIKATPYNFMKDEVVARVEVKNSEDLANLIKTVGEHPEINNLTEDEKNMLRQDIYAKSPDNVVKDYEEDINQELIEKSNEADLSMENGEEIKSDNFELSDGSDVSLIATDVEDTLDVADDPFATDITEVEPDDETLDEENGLLKGSQGSPIYSAETKKYGNRSWSSSITYKSWGVPIGKIVLSNHYTINNNGLTMRYTSKAGTWDSSAWKVVSASTKTTDKYAQKVGYDLNGAGWYTIQAYGSKRYFELRSTIQLSKLDKKKKTAYVVHKYKYYGE